MKKSIIISFIDQGMLSAFNMVLSILFIKVLSFSEFGSYSLAFAYGLTLISFQNALSTTPMSIMTKKRVSSGLSKYQNLFNLNQYIFLLCTAAISLLFSGFTGHSWLIICFYSISFCFREYVKNQLLLNYHLVLVFIVDLVFVVLTSALLLGCFFLDMLSESTVLVSLAFSSFVGTLCVKGYCLLGIDVSRTSVMLWFRFFKVKVWRMARWTTLGVSLTELYGRSYLYIINIAWGQDILGLVQGARVLFGPLNLFLMGWFRVGRNYMASCVGADDKKGFNRFFWLSIFGFVVLSTGVIILVNLAWGIIEPLLFDEANQDMYYAVMCWGLVMFTVNIRMVVSTALQAYSEFKKQALFNALCAIVTVGSGYIITQYLFWQVMPFSVFLGELTLLLCCSYYLKKIKNKNSRSLTKVVVK
ncbi:hypothetical protein L3Q72_08090 [Vibrio sp. JC009]|uniref:lipopolysaccharide biosynthesis protein n=1 Tax=Vibrio sp. JC009 TaxID=2912314 RepID=UPI0023B03543|nr:hypothetical protein [Vibrio sp. JC009]WED20612.1 hypothetical protein L3Q72_08090 [Vibrio sp. JC009]